MFEQTFKNIGDVLWKEAGCSSELDYTEQTSWMLFLKYLDDLEGERAIEVCLDGDQDAIWLSQEQMTALFDVQIGRTVSRLETVREEGRGVEVRLGLVRESNMQKMHIAH